ncbi:MAG TPA: TMEM165/GDT1 family protein [Geobacteraceae bacterium]|nr:TMEM165/GDT1 family protein [Geobacteraceae bacterium]
MDFTIFFTTFGFIFLAELGDKTQLTAMALAVRFPWIKTFIGIAAAFSLLNICAVALGKILFAILPLFWIKLVSAGLFLFFGVATLLGKGCEKGDDEVDKGSSTRGAITTSFFMILVAELGDKTQLVTASLAAQHDKPLEVFAGSTLALWSVSLLGIFAGRQLTRFIPLSYIHRAAGCLFLIFGVATSYQALSS